MESVSEVVLGPATSESVFEMQHQRGERLLLVELLVKLCLARMEQRTGGAAQAVEHIHALQV
jgi:hypothetical protein